MTFPSEKFSHLDNKQLLNLKYFYKCESNLAMVAECDAEFTARLAAININRTSRLWCDECHYYHAFIIDCPYLSDEQKENYRQNMAGL